MPRLPQVGGDDGNWGQILNDFLSRELFNDPNDPTNPSNGALKIRTNGTLDGKYTKPAAGIPKTDFENGVQSSLDKADAALGDLTAHQSDPDAHGIPGLLDTKLSIPVRESWGNAGASRSLAMDTTVDQVRSFTLNTNLTVTLTAAANSRVVLEGKQDTAGGRTLMISDGASANFSVGIPSGSGASFQVEIVSIDGVELLVRTVSRTSPDPAAFPYIDRGLWQPSTAYALWDSVTRSNGVRYLRKAAGVSSATFDATNWLPLGGVARAYAEVAADNTLTAAGPTDWADIPGGTAGPSVTIDVPANGIVKVYVECDVLSDGAVVAQVGLQDNVDFSLAAGTPMVLQSSSNAWTTLRSQPNGSGGTSDFLGGMLCFKATPGQRAYKLVYRLQTAGGTAHFRSRRIWVEV